MLYIPCNITNRNWLNVINKKNLTLNFYNFISTKIYFTNNVSVKKNSYSNINQSISLQLYLINMYVLTYKNHNCLFINLKNSK